MEKKFTLTAILESIFKKPFLKSYSFKKGKIEFEKGNKEARNKLIEHNLRLVAHIVKKFENTKIDKRN